MSDMKIGSVTFGPALRGLPGAGEMYDPIMFAIDLSALPPAARPAVAAALQAAVGRLAAGELPIEPRQAEDAVLAELVKGQMRSILAGAARAECPTCKGDGEITEDVAQAGDQTLTETYACPDCTIYPGVDTCRHGTPFRYACEACGDGPGAGE